MKASPQDLEIVTRNGKPVSVIIPIKEYEELLERAEDAGDVAWLKRARRKPLHYRPLEEYLAERNSNEPCIASCLNALPRRNSPDSPPKFTTGSSRAIQALAKNPRPRGCRKLAGSECDWRIRVELTACATAARLIGRLFCKTVSICACAPCFHLLPKSGRYCTRWGAGRC
jgi:PHD/YefM family antitoxin component YafN of YafNO toxin-antitoxin module